MTSKFWRSTALAAAMAAAFMAAPAHATGEVWDLNWTPANGFGGLSKTWGLSDAGSAYAAWNVFNDADPGAGIYDMTPDAGSFGVSHTFVYETGTAGAFLTGGGNIYSFSGPTNFQTYIQGTDMSGTGVRDVVLRIETLGTGLATSSVKLNDVAPTSFVYQDVGALGGMGGNEFEGVFVWKNVVNTGAPFMFTFNAAGSSMSFAQTAMYYSAVAAVPEPHEWMLMVAGLGLVGMTARSRRNARKTTS